MIRIDRGRAPSFSASKDYHNLKQKLEDFFKKDYGLKKRQTRYGFDPVQSLIKEVGEELRARFAHKLRSKK